MFLTRGPRVFTILLNYRNPTDTIRCIASLRRANERAIHPVVVDNASGGTDVSRLRHVFGPTLPILESDTNGGYAAGNNLGIRYALERDADFVWILNPDTEVDPRALQLMMATMTARSDVGFAGTLNVFGGSAPPIVQFAGGKIDWDGGAITESIGRGKPVADIQQKDPYEVDYVAGASMLVRRQVFEEVGLIPEQYFLYFEETDLQVRAGRQGWKSVLNPAALVWHYQQSGASLPAPYYTYYYIRGRMLFGRRFTKHTLAALEEGLAGFIEGWRTRVLERAPSWLETYDRLVTWGLEDGRNGVTGPRPDVNAMQGPELSHG